MEDLLKYYQPATKGKIMGKVIIHATMSLDGFIAGPHDEMDWVFKGEGTPVRGYKRGPGYQNHRRPGLHICYGRCRKRR
jgi:hypothetical protein